MDVVKETWNEIGYRIRPLFGTVFIRTDKIETQSPGGIHFPSTTTGFYDGPMHMRLVNATVLATGKAARPLDPGERVCFQRKYFSRWKTLEDGTYVGWVNVQEIAGVLEGGLKVDKHIDFPEGPKAIREVPV